MCGRLDFFQERFAALPTARNRSRWHPDTCCRAPHQPLLLLAVLDLIAAGSIARNFIVPDADLAETFDSYWNRAVPDGRAASLASPFQGLASSGFWHLSPKSGSRDRAACRIRSIRRLRERYHGARFSEDLFPLLVMASSRSKLRDTLITTFFAENLHGKLL